MSASAANLRVILTGATGMVGEGVLLECVENPAVSHVLMVNRRPSPLRHRKLQELIVPDFFSLDAVAPQLAGYDACFFCAGVSSVGMSEAGYTRVTHDLTVHFAQTLASLNPGMTFIYVSGAMTDSTEKGRAMWARVKGRTENDLMKLGFARVYNFRPGFMRATQGQRNILPYYKFIAWLYPIARVLVPNRVSTLRQVGRAMIHAAQRGYPKSILEIEDINMLAAG